jgi:hypothetical protein
VAKVCIVAAFLVAAAVACTQAVPDGHFACGEADCPPGMTCADDGLCYWNPPRDSGLPPAIDAPIIDAPPAADSNGGAPDAPPLPPDAAPPPPDAPPPPPDAPPPPVDCSPIAANPNYQLCESSTTHCAGVYLDGAGCNAYCGAAGLVCVARFGGQEGCIKEADYPIPCNEVNTHESDWCECEAP